MSFYNFSFDFSEDFIQSVEPVIPQPTPEQEIKRSEVLDVLKKDFENFLKQKLNITYFPTIFSRWLFLQVATKDPTTNDPVLRRPEVIKEAKSIIDAIIDNYPVSTYIPWTKRSNLKIVRTTIQKWIHELEKKFLLKDQNFIKIKKLLRENIEASEMLEKFRLLKNSLNQEIKKIIGKDIENIFEKFIARVYDQIQLIPEINEEDYHDVCIEKTIVTDEKNKYIVLTYNKESLKITQDHYKKLKKLFIEQESKMDLQTSVWVLLKRYSKFICDPEEKSEQFHAAAPKSFFEFINEQFDVSFECFASPLNCYFKNFCSAFVDTDRCFGSKGSFFYFVPEQGSFEVNPPYVEEVIEYTADHIFDLLKSSKKPLLFIVGVPDWREPLQKGQEKIEKSNFLKGQFTLEGTKYEYVSGAQHKCNNTFNMPFTNRFYLIQNEAGSRKWPIKEKVIDEMKKSFQK